MVKRLGPLLFLPGLSGRLLRHGIQGDLGPGSLALRCRFMLSVSSLYFADPQEVGAPGWLAMV